MSWKGEIFLDGELFPTQQSNVSRSWQGEIFLDERFGDQDFDGIDPSASLSRRSNSIGTAGRPRHSLDSGRASPAHGSPLRMARRLFLSVDAQQTSPVSSPTTVKKLHHAARSLCRRSPTPSPMRSRSPSPQSWRGRRAQGGEDEEDGSGAECRSETSEERKGSLQSTGTAGESDGN